MPVPSSSEGLNKTPDVTFHASTTRKRVLNGVVVPAATNSPRPFPRTPGNKTAGVGSVAINDDAAERRQRRLQNTMNTMMSPGCHTPKNVPKTPASRVNAAESSTSSLSNTQIAEHYANCIKLSSQNKISSKNAFGLHLIDHMLQLLKVRGEMKNFQVASSTLDAGAKIYAGRVDSIYNDIFKILTGMGTKEPTTQGGENDKEDDAIGEDGNEATQSRKKHKSSSLSTAVVVEKNPKLLDMNTNSLEFAVDPLFKKTSAAFDEGGVDGLLFSQLFVRDESCSVVFETDVAPGTVTDVGGGVETDLDEIAGLLAPDTLKDLQIYPSFSAFLYESDDTPFSLSKIGGDINSDERGSISTGLQAGTDVDYSMLQCPPPVPDLTLVQDFNNDYDDDDDGVINDEGGMNFDHLDGTVLGVCKDNQMAQYISSGDKNPQHSVPVDGQKENMDLFLMEAIEPTEYSYFKPAVVASWAGPQHWKVGARNVEKKGEQSVPKKRQPVAQFRMDFTQVLDASSLSRGKASTQLSRNALLKMQRDQTTLPQDSHADMSTLHKLFCRPKWKVTRQHKQMESLDDGPTGVWYDYNNPNDNVNYCPLPNQDMDDYDDDDDNCFDGAGVLGDDFVQNDTVFDYDRSGSVVPLREEDSQLLVGERLVAQPKKVQQIQIDYARNAKKIDVKKLKLKIWEILNDDTSENHTDGGNPVNESQTCTTEFSALYSTLPSKLPENMAKNVSVSICFVCLLHLANEKSLNIAGDEDLSNLHICTS